MLLPHIKNRAMLISIVIPSYNGSQTVGGVVAQLIEHVVPLFSIEIILINDGSRDITEAICTVLAETHPGTVRFFSLARNFGEHNAVMAGLNQVHGDYVLIMDDDFQNPVTEVIKLIRYTLEHLEHDVVYTYYAEKKHSYLRNLGSRFNDTVANVMLQKPKDLYLSSFKMFNRFIVDEIIKYDFPFTYIDGLILQTTDKIGKVLVEHSERTVGRSSYTFLRLLSLWSNMFTNFSIIPLRISIIIGCLLSALGFLYGIEAFIEKMLNPNLPQGYTSLIVIVLFFSGVQLIFLGILGEYAGRIFLAQNKAPQFVIRRTVDLEKK